MSKLQTLLIPILAGILFLVSAAVELPSSPLVLISGGKGKDGRPRNAKPARPAADREEPVPNPQSPAPAQDADAILQQAIARYRPEKITWLELTLWQRAAFGEVDYEVDGHFLAAPEQRLRLELSLQSGPVAGKMVLVSDGRVLCESLHVPGAPDRTTRTPLPPLHDDVDNPGAIQVQREELLNQRSFRGVGPLLQKIQQNLRRPQLAGYRWQGKDVLQIRGAWELGEKSAQDLPSELRLGQVVRECRLYLDAQTYWPVRIEWWGSPALGQPQVRLVETEYRNPVLNQPLSPERLARAFRVSK